MKRTYAIVVHSTYLSYYMTPKEDITTNYENIMKFTNKKKAEKARKNFAKKFPVSETYLTILEEN